MLNRLSVAIYALAIVTATGLSRPDMMSAAAAPASNGVVKVKSLYGFDDTINRLKADIAQKGIGARVIWSQWEGYLEEGTGACLQAE